MTNSIGLQYAKAIFDLACEAKCANDYFDALKVINDTFKAEEIVKTFSHPLVSKDEKKEILSKSIGHLVDEVLINFLFVLIDNDRLMDLSLIISAYKELLNEYENKLEVNVYSKYPLTEEQRVDVSNKLKNYYQKKIILNELVDESLIGGIKVECNGEVIDTTLLQSLNNLKNSLKKGW